MTLAFYKCIFWQKKNYAILRFKKKNNNDYGHILWQYSFYDFATIFIIEFLGQCMWHISLFISTHANREIKKNVFHGSVW